MCYRTLRLPPRDWERRATNIAGVLLLKLPSSRTRQAAVAIEINPVNATGLPIKKWLWE